MPEPEPAADLLLRRSWLRELREWWRYYDWIYLNQALRTPGFGLTESTTVLGRWWSERRLIEISVQHVWSEPWPVVLETLRHEMAHQFVDEVLRVDGEAPHGPAFVEAARRLRVDARACSRACSRERLAAATRTASERASVTESDGIHDKIERLLSLAGSPNEHEAQTAMKKARQLLLRHNLELRDLRRPAAYAIRRVGALKLRRSAWEYQLGCILSDFFFVQILWADDYDARRGKKGKLMELSGTQFNLDMAEYVHGWLQQLLPRLWQEYRVERAIRSQRERSSYYAGVLHGFREKLEQQESHLREDQALIWTGDPGLDAYFDHHNPRIKTRKSAGVSCSDAYWDGVSEGKKVQLHRPLKRGASDRDGKRTPRLHSGDSEATRSR